MLKSSSCIFKNTATHRNTSESVGNKCIEAIFLVGDFTTFNRFYSQVIDGIENKIYCMYFEYNSICMIIKQQFPAVQSLMD